MHSALDIMCIMNIETNMEALIVQKIEPLVRNKIRKIQRMVNIPNLGVLDLLLTTQDGQKFAIEIKNRITRFQIGELTRLAILLSKALPSSKLFLVSNKVDPVSKDILNRIGITTIELAKFSWKPSKSHKAMELSPREQESYFILLRKGIGIVTPKILSLQLDIPIEYSKNILINLNRKGMSTKIGRGRYVIISPDVIYGRKKYTADPLTILQELVTENYYVGYASAMYIHGLSIQIPFQTLVAVTKQKRAVKIGTSLVKFIRIPKNFMFGYYEHKYLNSYFNVSDIEKSIVDCIDRHDLCGGIVEVTRNITEALPKIDTNKLFTYLNKIGKPILIQRCGFILERLNSEGFAIDSKLLNKLASFRFKYVYPLDYTQSKRGETSKRWKIIENINLMDWKNA